MMARLVRLFFFFSLRMSGTDHNYVLAPTPAAQPQSHDISVGANGQLAFSPPDIQASVGDTVTFHFNPKNHSVTQSSFSKPCVPLADATGGNQIGFNSGFMPVAADATQSPTFQITVNDVRLCR
jgi:plastocyanin